MIIDTLTQFCTAASVAASVGTTLIGNQIDTATAGELDVDNLYLTIVATSAIVAAGAGTIQFKLASDISAAIATDGTAQIEFSVPAFVTSATPIPYGTVLFEGELPANVGTYNPNRRYLGLLEVVMGSAVTSGNVTAFLGLDGGRWAATPIAAN